jgi:hypothetical protein
MYNTMSIRGNTPSQTMEPEAFLQVCLELLSNRIMTPNTLVKRLKLGFSLFKTMTFKSSTWSLTPFQLLPVSELISILLDVALVLEITGSTGRYLPMFYRIECNPRRVSRTSMAPAHAPLPRATLDSSKHQSIDVFLKSLKLRARTLDLLFAQHATELAVLERLYYLNNNQHRQALFWQRIVEARRYSRRLGSLYVPLLVDGLRRSFHGDTTDKK